MFTLIDGRLFGTGGTALNFQPWEDPAVAAPALSASASTGV